MKKFLLVLSFFTLVVSLTSYKTGFGDGAGQGVTGAPGENGGSCGQSGCHSAGAFDPSLSVTLTDSEGETVTEYLPEQVYTVSLKINHGTAAIPGGYGFQMVCLDADDDSPINSFSDFPQDVGPVTINGRQYVEQTARLPVDSIFMTWTAPAESTGPVTFYAIGNAANGNGGSQGDGVANDSFTFNEGEISTTNDIETIELGIYPNPTVDYLNVPNSISVASMEIMSMDGKLQITSYSNQVDISELPSGTYVVSLSDKNQKLYRQVIQKR